MTQTQADALLAGLAGRALTWAGPEGDSAVLIPLIETDRGSELLFEKRSPALHQGGEICFPGGRIEPGEAPEQAALREAREELLLREDQIQTLIPMHRMPGPGGITVTSYLGRIHSYQGTFSSDEVSRVLSFPLDMLLDMPVRRYDGELIPSLPEDFPYELIPGGKSYHWRRIPRSFWFYQIEGAVIWGLTGELLFRALEEIRRMA